MAFSWLGFLDYETDALPTELKGLPIFTEWTTLFLKYDVISSGTFVKGREPHNIIVRLTDSYGECIVGLPYIYIVNRLDQWIS
jgi:hypothetical protein